MSPTEELETSSWLWRPGAWCLETLPRSMTSGSAYAYGDAGLDAFDGRLLAGQEKDHGIVVRVVGGIPIRPAGVAHRVARAVAVVVDGLRRAGIDARRSEVRRKIGSEIWINLNQAAYRRGNDARQNETQRRIHIHACS